MKSTIFSILPLVGLAVAQQGCTRQIVTKTETEKVYVTVQPSETTITSTIDSTITSTIDITTTITVDSSSSVEATATGLHWGNYPNGTYSNHTVRPRPHLSSVTLDYTPSVIIETPAATSSQASESSEVAIPTSEAPTAVETSSAYEAPATSAYEAPATSAYEAPATSETSAAAALPTVKVEAVSRAYSGEATFYGGNLDGGHCSFSGYTIPSSLFGTALSSTNWNTASNCGRCVSVTGPSGNKITAMVVDECPTCGTNALDLFENAFSKLAAPSVGEINVNWDFVSCGITTPIVLKNKEGTSPYWFSMQVLNANVGVSKLEVSTDGGKTWKATTRQKYNYFENSAGYGTTTVDVKVTSVSGQSIVVKDVSIAANTSKTGGSNFS